MKFRLWIAVIFLLVMGSSAVRAKDEMSFAEKIEAFKPVDATQKKIFEVIFSDIKNLCALNVDKNEGAYPWECTKAAFFCYEVALDMLNAHKPEQAIVMYCLGTSVQKALCVDVLEEQQNERIAKMVELEKDLALMLTLILGLEGAKQTKKNIQLFNKAFKDLQYLPNDQQIKQIVSVVALFVLPKPRQSNDNTFRINLALSQIVKVAKIECARLKKLQIDSEQISPETYAPFSLSSIKAVKTLEKNVIPPQDNVSTLQQVFVVGLFWVGTFATYQYWSLKKILPHYKSVPNYTAPLKINRRSVFA